MRASCRVESPAVVAARGAQGAGRRRAHVRGHHVQGRRRLRPVRRHALAGLRRRGGGDGVDEPGRHRDARPGRHLPGRAGRHVLLLDLGRAHRGRREHQLGTEPKPWLKSVKDPYDSVSPQAPLGPDQDDARPAPARKLGGLVKGRFKGVKVVRRGESPRIVAADVIGSGGRTRVTAPRCARASASTTRGPTSPRSARARRSRRRRSQHRRRHAAAPERRRRRPAPAQPAGRHRLPGAHRRRGADPDPHRRTLAHGHVGGRPPRRQLQRRRRPRAGTYRAVFSGDAGPSVRVR